MDVADDGMTPAADAVVSPSQQVTPTKGPRPVFNADGKQIAPPPAVAEAPATEREAMEVEAPSAYHASTEGSVNTGNLGGGATDAMPEGSAPAAAEPEVVPDGTETVNAEHGDNAETLTPGDFDKSFYYLHFTVDSSEDRSAIPEINPVAFLNAVNKYGSEKSLPEIEPQKGLAGDKTGPWQVYMEGKALAEYLVSSFEPPFPVMFPGEKSLKVNMVARSVDAFIQNANPSANENYIRTSTVYSEIRLQQGFDFSYIFKRHVKASFIAMGLDVVRTARPQMAFEGEKLGASFVGNMINVVLAGKDKSIVEFMIQGGFTPLLHITFANPNPKKPVEERKYKYSVRAGKDAAPDIKEVAAALCGICHRLKPTAPEALLKRAKMRCVCIHGGPSSIGSGGRGGGRGGGGRGGGGRGGGGRGGDGHGNGKRTLADEAATRAKMAKTATVDRSSSPCVTFLAGRCARGFKCSFKHEDDGTGDGGRAKAKTITCAHVQAKPGICILGAKCIYLPQSGAQLNHISPYSLAKMALYCMRRRRRGHGLPRRRRYHKEFDSTMGYPGEGWAPPAGLRIIGMNPNGLKGQGRSRKMFAEAKRKRAAILLVQEHNFKASEMQELRRAAIARGFAPCVSPSAEDSSRGGTAIFLDREQLGLGSAKVPFETHLDGRVTTV